MAHKRDAVCSECGVLVVCHVVICSGVECWLCAMLSYVVVWSVGCVACCHM